MGCCGQKREALRDSESSTPRTVPAPVTPPAHPSLGATITPVAWAGPVDSPVAVRYLERSPVLVRGPATGRVYEFSSADAVQSVDGRDASALLRTRFFSRA